MLWEGMRLFTARGGKSVNGNLGEGMVEVSRVLDIWAC